MLHQPGEIFCNGSSRCQISIMWDVTSQDEGQHYETVQFYLYHVLCNLLAIKCQIKAMAITDQILKFRNYVLAPQNDFGMPKIIWKIDIEWWDWEDSPPPFLGKIPKFPPKKWRISQMLQVNIPNVNT